jgi:hypothetical protein
MKSRRYIKFNKPAIQHKAQRAKKQQQPKCHPQHNQWQDMGWLP